MREIDGLDGLLAAVGQELGTSGWVTIDQDAIQRFADLSGDQQWIHTDPERARTGPYGTTVAHGFMVLSMIPALGAQVYRVTDVDWLVNYGLDRVRFPAPLPVDSEIRATVGIASAESTERGLRVTTHHVVERKGSDRPICVADYVRLYGRSA